jgi:ATP-dependent Clp protease ATP-binding subunit ClpB
MDEACAHVRVELDSKPAALDGAARRILQLEIEATALEQEESWNIFSEANPRLATVKAKLVELRESTKQMEEDYGPGPPAR